MEILIVTGAICGFIGVAIGLAIGLSIGVVGGGISSNWPVAKPTPPSRKSKLKREQSSIPTTMKAFGNDFWVGDEVWLAFPKSN